MIKVGWAVALVLTTVCCAREWPPHKRFRVMDLPEAIWYRLLRNQLGKGRIHDTFLDYGNTLFVRDKLDRFRYSPVVLRSIGVKGAAKFVQTQLALKTPKTRTLADLDTSKWEIDRGSAMKIPYYHKSIDGLFSSGAIPRRKNAVANVLFIGIAGGGMNNWVAERLPNVNITAVELSGEMVRVAREHFQVREHERHRLIHGDGVEYLREAAKRGEKFDGIILDAAHFGTEHRLLAPVDVFMEEETVKDMARVLGTRGVMISNVMPGPLFSMTEEVTKLANIYDKFFEFVEVNQASAPGTENGNLILRACQAPFLSR